MLDNKGFNLWADSYDKSVHIREEKINFIKSLSSMLSKKGKILIGDVSFETRNELEKSKEKYREFWDNDEVYFIIEEIKESLNNHYFCKYIKISHCAGILTIENK